MHVDAVQVLKSGNSYTLENFTRWQPLLKSPFGDHTDIHLISVLKLIIEGREVKA